MEKLTSQPPGNLYQFGTDQARKDYAECMAEHGLSAADETRMGLALVPPAVIHRLLNFEYEPRWHGMLIPYPDSDYIRVRRLGKVGVGEHKYFSPKGSGHGPVYTPIQAGIDWADVRVNPEEPLVITEGELKADCCMRMGGVTTIGIGGVTMIRALLDGSWLWKGRSVLICFDHDSTLRDGTPILPGEYKPEVRKALGTLAAALTAKGASVQVLSVGMAATVFRDPTARKWGVDDYLLRAGAEGWKALIATARAPEPWVVELGEMLENCVLVRGTNQTHVYDLRYESRKGVKDFHDAWGEQLMEGPNGKPRPVSYEWYRHHQRLTVGNYCMDPTLPFGPTPRHQLNLWRPFPEWGDAVDSDVMAKWQTFVEGLFGTEDLTFCGRKIPTYKWVCLWVAHMLEHPEQRTSQAVLVPTPVLGIGKSLFGEIIAALVGEHHAKEVPSHRLDARFNSFIEGKVWLTTNEFSVLHTKAENELNALIDNATIDVEYKGRDVIVLPNLGRRYFTSNSAAACRLSLRNRRVLVVYPPRLEGDVRGEWGGWVGTEVAGWKGNLVALASIRKWFSQLWEDFGGRWNPTAPVPITEASLDMAEASMTTGLSVVEDLLELAKENGGTLTIDPVSKRNRRKIWAEFAARVRSLGGKVGQKSVRATNKLDGESRVVNYYVYDLYDVVKMGSREVKGVKQGYVVSDMEADYCRNLAEKAARLIIVQEAAYGRI